MLDALRHRFVQNVQTWHVAAAPHCAKHDVAPAPLCIPVAQWQKPMIAQKNLISGKSSSCDQMHGKLRIQKLTRN
jgi:hypothetical protein